MSANQFGKIGVLMGGYSSEREISLRSGTAIYEALRQAGCDVRPIDITEQEEPKIESLIGKFHIDVAFIALHGKLGEDGTIQSILEAQDIPYTGSGVKASRVAINKATTQRLFHENGIPVPPHSIIEADKVYVLDDIVSALGLPVVVKPACEGSSIGIDLVKDKENLPRAIQSALSYGHEVIIEKYVAGRELTVGILQEKALPVIEIRPRHFYFDFTAKYQQGLTDYVIPAPLSDTLTQKIQHMAESAHCLLGCQDMSRVDFILDGHENSFVLEVNTIPGFTATSLLPKAAKAAGIDFAKLCLKLLEFAYEKKR